MAKELFCPSCGPGFKLITKDNGDGVCASCNGTFHPGPEPKLVAVGEFDELKGRVVKLEGENAELRKLLPKPPDKPVPDAAFAEAEKAEEDL